MSEREEPKDNILQINELCKTCQHYKKDCKGMETIKNAIIVQCKTGLKYKKIKNIKNIKN